MMRYRVRKKDVGVSLFPFLAVLICTMGALIVLLVMVVQMARVDASETVVAGPPTQADKMRQQKEENRWRAGLLEQQRERLQDDIEDHRLELTHLEDHIRALQRRLTQMEAEAKNLVKQLDGGKEDQQVMHQRLEQLRAEISRAEDDLQRARKKAAQRPAVYAVIPYDGPNGTHRRPIYLECTAEGVIVQPEGVLLTTRDFQGPLGTGNPLDAVLRTMRTYLARTENKQKRSSSYPLLIVRPGGSEAYVMARAAMQAWDDEFGYELVAADKQLAFPKANSELKELLLKTVQDARSRQAILAAAMPSRFEREKDVGFIASHTRGGFEPQGGQATRTPETRRGGFGTGGDTHYADGRSQRSTEDRRETDPPQNIGGPADKNGTPGGHAGATCGANVEPLANTRGKNWGLPNRAAGATGVVRPIRVACLPDRLILLPDKGEKRAPSVVLVNGTMADEMDSLVSRIWDQVDQWGIAVAGGYWKPVLHVDVAQGAESRFDELKTLLIGSGLGLQRTSRETTPATIR